MSSSEPGKNIEARSKLEVEQILPHVRAPFEVLLRDAIRGLAAFDPDRQVLRIGGSPERAVLCALILSTTAKNIELEMWDQMSGAYKSFVFRRELVRQMLETEIDNLRKPIHQR